VTRPTALTRRLHAVCAQIAGRLWNRVGAGADPRGGRSVVVAWLATRVLAIVLLVVAERLMVGDVWYYRREIDALPDAGMGGTLVEYPTPVVWLLGLPYLLGAGTSAGYLVVFVGSMLALDAAFTLALTRAGGGRRTAAVDLWLVFVPLLGPLVYVRFDMLPTVLVGAALLAVRRRPATAGGLIAGGAAVKLWPAILIVPLVSGAAATRRALGGFAAACLVLAGGALLGGGWDRLVSPLRWQADRGLQIESVWAAVPMAGRMADRGRWTVGLSEFNAFEILGPGVDAWLTVSTVATVLGLGLIAALLVRTWRAAPGADAVALVMLAVVTVMIVVNKTLSPQYLLWFGAPCAAALLARPDPGPALRRIVGLLMALALLTHVLYPYVYDGLIGQWGDAGVVATTLALLVRNGLLLALTGLIVAEAWRATARAGRPVTR